MSLKQARSNLLSADSADTVELSLYWLRMAVAHLIKEMESKSDQNEPAQDPDASESPREPSSDLLKQILRVAADQLAELLRKA